MSKKVLITDDEEVCREIFSEILRSAGYTVEIAASGKRCLELMDVFQPHLVVLDISMPEMDGLTVAQKVRELPEGAHIPILFITGLDTRQYRQQVEQVFHGTLLHKPVGAAYLIRQVQTLLQESEKNKVPGNSSHPQSSSATASPKPNLSLFDYFHHELRSPLNNILGFAELALCFGEDFCFRG
jgi:CheY-like chemotaxis protein